MSNGEKSGDAEEREADGEGEAAEAEGEASGGDGDGGAEGDAEAGAGADGDAEGDSDADGDGEGGAEADADADADADAGAEGDAEGDAGAGADGDAEGDAEGDADADAEGDDEPRGLSGHALAVSLCAAIAEGGVAANAVLVEDGGFGGALLGFVLAGLAVFTVFAALTTVLHQLLDTTAVRQAGGGLQDAIGSAPIAIGVGMVAAGLAVVGGSQMGIRLLASMTPPFAMVGTTLATVMVLALGVVALAPLGRVLARGLGERGRGPRAMAVFFGLVALAVLVIAVVLLPVEFVPVPVAALVPLAVFPLARRIRGRFARAATRLGWVTLPLTVLAGAMLTVVVVESAGGGVRGAVFRRAPYVGNLVAFVWKATDNDGDGYSPYLAGGDCDDRNPQVNPDAPEIIGNGIDENCSGGDAPPYVPAEAPTQRWRVPTPQNIVLLQMDALRPDHLGFAGYERPTSPNIDRFREGATWFRNAYTNAPSTRFAMSSAFTGYDVRRLPFTSPRRNGFVLGPRAPTAAEALRSRGYDTFGLTITYVLDHNHGLGQGFREWKTPWPQAMWRENYPVAAEKTTDALLDYLGRRPVGAGPYFAFAHYRCTHDPYIGYDEWPYGNGDIDRYDSALNYCDDQLKRVFDALDARADRGRTAIIVFSDHGELFGEHGLTNHGRWLYEEDLRVLLLADIPGVDEETVDTPVTLADLGVTLFELGGVRAPADPDGWSLLHHVAEVPERPIFVFNDLWVANVHVQADAVIEWPYKLIRDVSTGAIQIFDVVDDPRESQNLADDDDQQERRERLSSLVDSFAAHMADHPVGR